MAISSIVKNFRDGTITIEDGTTPTPISMTVQFENGDFSITGLSGANGNAEITTYLDRGVLGSVRRTNQTFPSGSWSLHLTDISDATSKTIYDCVDGGGAWASMVSTLGANADVTTVKITLTIAGTTLGDPADHTIVMDDCALSIDVSEGDPSSFACSFVCYGSITAT
jgi:hypothetical protein